MKLKFLMATTVLGSAIIGALALGQSGTKLTVWMVGGDDDLKDLVPVISAYKAKYKGTEVQTQAVPWGDAFTKYLAAVAGKTGPDIITGGLSYGIELGKQGGMINLKEKYPDLVASTSKTANQGVMRSVVSTDGSVYGLPYDLTLQIMYYRKDIVTTAPRNWNEFTAALDKIRSSGGKGFAQQWGNAGWLGFFPYVYQAGGTFYDAKCSKATINSAAGVTALNYYGSLYTKFKSPTDGWPDMESGLENGEYPIGQTGNWALFGIPAGRPKLEGKWAIATLPAGPAKKRTAFIGGRVIGIMSYSKNQDAAANFLRTFYKSNITTEVIKASAARGNLFLPGGRQDMIPLVNLPTDQKSVLLKQLADSEGPSNCPGWEQSGDALQNAVQSVIFKGANAKEVLDAAAAEMDKNLVKYK